MSSHTTTTEPQPQILKAKGFDKAQVEIQKHHKVKTSFAWQGGPSPTNKNDSFRMATSPNKLTMNLILQRLKHFNQQPFTKASPY